MTAALQDPTVETFAAQFAASEAALPGASLDWVRRFRRTGFERFSQTGLPTPAEESWRYTSLRPLEREAFRFDPRVEQMPSIDKAPSLLPMSEGCHRLVFVNGRFHPGLSTLSTLPEGAVLETFAAALERHPDIMEAHLGRVLGDDEPVALAALNSALATDGVVLHLRAGVSLAEPIEIIHLGGVQAGLCYHPRNLFVLERGSQATVIENHRGLGEASYFANMASEILLEEGALLRHYKQQSEGAGGYHTSMVGCDIGARALYDNFTLSIGARLSRNELRANLRGEGGECHINGAYLMRGQQHCDNTTAIHHLVPRTSCREVFKGVVDDGARAVFQGRIVVHPDAQQTNGHQLSRVLLLSDKAEIDQKPELEIHADDVLCSHGATAGDLDHDALFYLRSRGIPEAKARSILIEAFLAEAVTAIAAEGLCPALMTSIGHWLADA